MRNIADEPFTHLTGSEFGLATHYVPSRTIPSLMGNLAQYENPSFAQIDCAIEELYSERQPDESSGKLTGAVRNALDSAFRHHSVEEIIDSLAMLSNSRDIQVSGWAKQTLDTLDMRSPTSLKVALEAIRRGKNMSLRDALQMEMGIATAYCVSHTLVRLDVGIIISSFQSGASPDFHKGIGAVLIDRIKGRPEWSPERIEDVSPEILDRFFSDNSSYRSQMPWLSLPDTRVDSINPMTFALLPESKIVELVRSSCQDGPVPLSRLLSDMESLIKEKLGTKEKIIDVIHRRCQVVDDQGTTIVAWKEQ